jgi:hypothetical protein
LAIEYLFTYHFFQQLFNFFFYKKTDLFMYNFFTIPLNNSLLYLINTSSCVFNSLVFSIFLSKASGVLIFTYCTFCLFKYIIDIFTYFALSTYFHISLNNSILSYKFRQFFHLRFINYSIQTSTHVSKNT